MNKKELFFEYLKTFFVTVLIVVAAVIIMFAIIKHRVYQDLSAKDAQENKIDYYLIGVLIEKNKYLEQQDPKNYKFDLKLGVLYELKQQFKDAEFEYKQAIEKVPFGEYKPYFRLALMYIRLNRLEDAENLINSIKDQPDKKLIEYKGDVFNKLGDKYYSTGDYEEAVSKYQTALLYYNIIKAKQLKALNASLASAYVYLADEKVQKMQINDAITSLQAAKKIVNAPIIKYKLALLLMNSNPELAYTYFDEVFKKEPRIINYEQYNNFLLKMAALAEEQGYEAKAELCKFKIKQLKEYYKKNILAVEDLDIDNISGKFKLNNWTKKYNIHLDFKLKNISKYPMTTLFIDVVFKDEYGVINDYVKQIVDKRSILKPNTDSPLISIKTFKKQTKKDFSPKIITAQIYVSKTQDSYKILLREIKIQETVKLQKNKTKKHRFGLSSLKHYFQHP